MDISGRRILLICTTAALLLAITVPAIVAAESMTRGSTATINIAGKPNTPYYVWFTGTSSMSGEPHDQPPVFIGNTEGVVFDPDGGPYVIGSYAYNNGNGRTILDDVCPSSATTSNTRYYAQVTTDQDGFGIIQFTTSLDTATRNFPIRAENPANPGEEVPVALGLPPKRPNALSISAATETTAVPRIVVTISATTAVPATNTVTTTTVSAPPPVATSAAPTTKKAPVDSAVIILATVAGTIFLHRRE